MGDAASTQTLFAVPSATKDTDAIAFTEPKEETKVMDVTDTEAIKSSTDPKKKTKVMDAATSSTEEPNEEIQATVGETLVTKEQAGAEKSPEEVTQPNSSSDKPPKEQAGTEKPPEEENEAIPSSDIPPKEQAGTEKLPEGVALATSSSKKPPANTGANSLSEAPDPVNTGKNSQSETEKEEKESPKQSKEVTTAPKQSTMVLSDEIDALASELTIAEYPYQDDADRVHSDLLIDFIKERVSKFPKKKPRSVARLYTLPLLERKIISKKVVGIVDANFTSDAHMAVWQTQTLTQTQHTGNNTRRNPQLHTQFNPMFPYVYNTAAYAGGNQYDNYGSTQNAYALLAPKTAKTKAYKKVKAVAKGQPIKKKRGRPPNPPKKRGRPRKYPPKDPTNNPSAGSQMLTTTTNTTTQAQNIDPSTRNPPQPWNANASLSTTEQPVKKKRGRPRKYPPTNSSAGSQTLGNNTIVTEATKEKPAKKKRGRPRKYPPTESPSKITGKRKKEENEEENIESPSKIAGKRKKEENEEGDIDSPSKITGKKKKERNEGEDIDDDDSVYSYAENVSDDEDYKGSKNIKKIREGEQKLGGPKPRGRPKKKKSDMQELHEEDTPTKPTGSTPPSEKKSPSPRGKSREIYSGVPDDKIEYSWEGWTKKTFQRKGGVESFWFSPEKGYKLRSLREVKKFMEGLQEHKDESSAWLMMKGRK